VWCFPDHSYHGLVGRWNCIVSDFVERDPTHCAVYNSPWLSRDVGEKEPNSNALLRVVVLNICDLPANFGADTKLFSEFSF